MTGQEVPVSRLIITPSNLLFLTSKLRLRQRLALGEWRGAVPDKYCRARMQCTPSAPIRMQLQVNCAHRTSAASLRSLYYS